MSKILSLSVVVALFLAGTSSALSLSADQKSSDQQKLAKTMVVNLLRSNIASVDDHEVIMTNLELPEETNVPKHTHPTEEFFYVMEGETKLVIDGQGDQIFKAGMAGMIPAEAPHTAHSGPNGAKMIIFRVHKKGEPVRTAVE